MRRRLAILLAAVLAASVLAALPSTPASAAVGTGSIELTVTRVGPEPSIEWYSVILTSTTDPNFYQRLDSDYLEVVDDTFTFPGLPAGTYKLSVGVGGPGTNAASLGERSNIVVGDGEAESLAMTIDARAACVTGRVRTADGSAIQPGLILFGGQPGGLGMGTYVPAGSSSWAIDENTFWCGLGGTFVVRVDDGNNGGITVAASVVTVAPGGEAFVDLVIGATQEGPVSSATGARVLSDGSGGSIVTVRTGSVEAVGLTFAASCPGGAAPSSVSLVNGGVSFAATSAGSGNFTATIPRASVVPGSLWASVTCGGSTSLVNLGVIVLYDPSGQITDGETDDPIEGATVTLYRVPGWVPRSSPSDTAAATCESNQSKGVADWGQPAPTELGEVAPVDEGLISPNVASQATDDDGRYAWDVAYGCWYVTVTAPGYQSLTSPVVGVPTAVTDLDLALTPLAAGDCDAERFTDVDDNNGFCGEITWLVNEEIAGGYPDGTFRPTVGVSRQAIAAWLFAFAGNSVPVGPCDTTGGFTDVLPSHPFCKQIMWMVNEGVAEGYPDGTFRPSNLISRQAAAAFMFRLAGQVKGSSCPSTGFGDVPSSQAFCQEIAWAVSEGITNGYPDSTFRPTANISRQAGAAFLFRASD